MSYKTDGSVHYKGIEVEYDIVDFAQKMYDSGFDIFHVDELMEEEFGHIGTVVFQHEGGTGNKADAVVVCTSKTGKTIQKTISIKKKKYENNRPKGTFDVINTSLSFFENNYHIFGQNVLDKLNQWMEDQIPFIKTEEDIDNIRIPCMEQSNNALSSVDDKTKSFVDLTNKEFFKTDYLVVAKTEDNPDGSIKLSGIFIEQEKNIHLFDDEDLEFFTKKGNGNSSRRIWCKTKNGAEIETPFRVRLVLNNGLSAYYGLSSSNSNSVWTIKIQVDNVEYITNQMKYFKIEN